MYLNLIFFFFPLFFISCFLGWKYYSHRKEVENNGEHYLYKDSVEETKNIVFTFIDDLKTIFEKQSKFLLHWILHFFVIILGIISEITDYLYSKSRDLFLKTATKEKEIVAKFWPHLKEYKKEQDGE